MPLLQIKLALSYLALGELLTAHDTSPLFSTGEDTPVLYYKRDMDIVEKIQQRAMKMKELENL